MRQEITDCVQMTLDDWMEMKKKIRLELLGVKQSFVRIGYALRKIDDGRLYERDGYKSIAEFAKEEYGLEASTVSRFMSINREYSVDGYSEILRPEYEKLGRSQLEEMLKLPESDREMVRPETSREDIRELKRFNKQEGKENEVAPAQKTAERLKEDGISREPEKEQETIVEEQETDEVGRLVENFYRDNKDTLDEVRKEWPDGTCQAKRLAEIVNPSGSRSYRKGFYFLMLNESEVFAKKFGETPKQMTWEEFAKRTDEVLANWTEEPEKSEGAKKACSTRKDWGDKKFEEEKTAAETPGGGSQEPEDGKKEQESKENEIAPAQKTAERLKEHGILEEPEKEQETKVKEQGDESEEIPGQTTVYDFPEMLPEGYEKAEEQDGEKTTEGQQDEPKERDDKAHTGQQDDEDAKGWDEEEFQGGKRKEFLDSLTEYGMAAYMQRVFREGRGPKEVTRYDDWERWLKWEVDKDGREVEEMEWY